MICSRSSRRCTGRGRSGRSWSSPRLRSSAVAGGWLAISTIAGVLAAVVARAMAQLVDEQSLSKTFDEVTRLGQSPQFPLVRLAIVAAVVAAASPYVTRPTRRLGQLFVFVLAFSAMYLGTGYPSDILAALFLGWGVAALVHLAFGSPGGRPTTPQVAASLAELGVAARDVHLDPTQPTGASRFLAQDDQGPLSVRVIGRDEADSQFLAKLWRFVVYKDSGPQLYLTREQDVEHEAYILLLAERAGVQVPDVIVAGTAGPGAALIVGRSSNGRVLADLSPEEATDDLLTDLWRQVGALHDCADRARRAEHPQCRDRRRTPGDHGLHQGDDRGERAPARRRPRGAADVHRPARRRRPGHRRALGGSGCRRPRRRHPDVAGAGADPHHPGGCWASTAKRGSDSATLRTAAAKAAGVDVPELVELHRVSPTNLMMAIGTLVAAAVLLGQVGSPQEIWDTVKNAEWWLVGLALVLSLATNIPYAIALMGCVPDRLPLWPTTETQLAMSFGNLAIPAVGGIAIQIRYLQKRGLDLASAVGAGGLLSTVGNVVCQILLFVIAVVLSPTTVDIGPIDTASAIEVVLIAIVVIFVAIGLIWGIPRLRKAIVPPVKSAASTIWEAVRSPRRLALLVIGNFGVSLVYGFVLLACIAAYGGHVNYWSMLAYNIGISTIASLIPVPGGGTAVSSIGMSGALVTLGVPEAVAVSAILTQQLVVSYIPAIPGWWASNDLLKRSVI